MMKAGLLPVAETERVGGLGLAFGQGLQAAADDLGEVGAGEQYEGDLRAQQFVDVDAGGHEQREHHAGHEQNGDQRHAADQLHVEHAEHFHGRQFGGATAKRDQDGEREGEGGAEGGQDQGDRQAAPVVLGDQRQAEDAAPHQDADDGQRGDPDQRQFLAPEAAHGGDDVEADEQQHDDRRAPLLRRRGSGRTGSGGICRSAPPSRRRCLWRSGRPWCRRCRWRRRARSRSRGRCPTRTGRTGRG